MTGFNFPNFPKRHASDEGQPPPRPPRIPMQRPGAARTIVALVLALVILYGGYFWMIRRVVVGPSEVLVLLKKDGYRSLPGDEVIVPRMPDQKIDADGYAKWKQKYDGCNGILEAVYPAGTYFKF